MKIRAQLPLLVLFVTGPVSLAQENLKLDSLLQVYREQEESIEKVKTIQELFYAEMYNTPEKARAYAREGIELSKK